MGLVEKIGRKLTAGPRTTELPVPDGSVTANGAQRVPQIVKGHDELPARHVCGHTDAFKEGPHPGLGITGHRNDSLIAIPNTKTVQSQAPSRRRDMALPQVPQAQPRVPQVQPQINNISPPTSRLIGQPPESRKPVPNSTASSSSGPSRGEAPRSAPGSSRGYSNTVHKQPSIASSLHSERSGPPVSFTNGTKRQEAFGEQRARSNSRPETSQRPINRPAASSQRHFGMSTRRMEDSAYHAGFRDAVAQLERERNARRAGPAMSH